MSLPEKLEADAKTFETMGFARVAQELRCKAKELSDKPAN